MSIILSFIAGTLFAVFFLALLRGGKAADEQAELYWEGYERGYSDACAKEKAPGEKL